MSGPGLVNEREGYWRELFEGYPGKKPFSGESSWATTRVVQATIPCADSEYLETGLKLRLVILHAWAAILSFHCGAGDIVISEVLSGAHLVPRRIQFESAHSVHDQLSAQIAQDTTFPADPIALSVLSNIEHYGTVEIINSQNPSVWSPPSCNSPYHISVTNKPSETIYVSLTFDSGLHEKDAQYVLDHLLSVIRQLLDASTLRKDQLNLMSPQEREFVQHLPCLAEINGFTPEDPYQYRYAFELLSRPLKAHPDNVAVEWENQPVYTFATLEATSNQLARYLMDRFSVRPKDIVMIFSTQSPVMIAVLYAILKIGAAYFPIDTDIPSWLFKQTVGQTNSSLILTIGELESTIRDLGWEKQTVSIDTSVSEWSLFSDKPIQHDPALGDPQTLLAYLNATSGSTGTPKIIMVSQSNLVHFIVEAAPAWGRSTKTRFSQIYEFNWDGIVDEIFVTHYSGGVVCVAPRADVETRLSYVFQSLQLTASSFSQTWGSSLDPSALPAFESPNFVGEPLTEATREKWLANNKHVIHMYGPSETVCGITMENPVVSSDLEKTPLGFSVGRESSVYIMLPTMRLAPVGCIGEIWVSGPTVCMGYYGDAEKTKTCFTVDPFRPQFRMYKTGDYGWINYEGRLFFHSRFDNQISHRGNRIETEHLESVLCDANSPWKVAAGILRIEDVDTGTIFFSKELIIGAGLAELQISLTSEMKTQAHYLLELGKSKLTPTYLPHIWVPMKALPCTRTGKLNRQLMKEFFHSLEPNIQDKVISMQY